MAHPYNRSAGLKIFFALLGAGGFFALIYILASLGPSEVVTDADLVQQRTDLDAENPRLEASRELIERYNELRAKGEATEADIALLEKAREGFEAVIRSLRSRDFGLEAERDRLIGRIHDLRGRAIANEADEYEKRALAMEEDRPNDALPLFRQALHLRERIRKEFNQSSAHSPEKISALQRKVDYLEMRPLKERSIRLEKAGDTALEDGNWELARTRYREAAEIQEYINVNSPVGQLGDLRRANGLRDKEASVVSGPIYTEIQSLTQRAGIAYESELYDEAARLYERAEIEQARLNREFPRSYYASREREAELRQAAANARSVLAFEEIVSAEAALQAKLRARNIIETIDRIDQLLQQIELYRTRYSGATHPIGPIEKRINYLAGRRNDLGPIQEAVYGQSIRLPGGDALLMFRSEVPQWLYEIVTGNNPSRELGLNRPVESVTYDEAQEFCSSLSILLGRRVRLPTLEELNLAVGNRSETGKPARVWSSGTTPRPVATSQPNPIGYFDLLGNVAEWALARPSGATFTYGGTIRDLLSVIHASEPSPTPRTERNRLIGFRFVIENVASTGDR